MAVQQGRNECRPEAYSLEYVEGLNDARTPLADFFNSLSVDRPYHVYTSNRRCATSPASCADRRSKRRADCCPWRWKNDAGSARPPQRAMARRKEAAHVGTAAPRHTSGGLSHGWLAG